MKDSIKSIIVISAICLVVAAALGVTNYFTKDVIAEGTEMRTQEALKELISEAESFEEISVESYESLPDTVTAIYKGSDGTGYVFKIETKGYDNGLVIMCAVSLDGKVIKTTTLSNNETPTIGGNKVINNGSYVSEYIGKDISSVTEVDGISGATVTSNAYNGAIRDALSAFSAVAADQK